MAEKRFIKGLFKDTGNIDQPEGTWRHAKNMVINKNEGAISNEGGTEFAGHLGNNNQQGAQNDKVIGAIEVSDDRTVLFIKDVEQDPGVARSEIGIWENNVYTILFNPGHYVMSVLANDLNFQVTHPIEGTYKIDAKGDLIVYWTDDLNPPRAFNVDRQIRESGTSVTKLYGISGPDLVANSGIDLLNLFPYAGPVPHIDIEDLGTHQGCIIEGGGLLTAVYHLALAYVDEDLVATNYLTVSNPIPIVDDFDSTTPTNKKDGSASGSQTTKAIKWDISNLNTNYKYLRPAIIRSKGEAKEVFKLNDIAFTSSEWTVVFTGLESTATGSVEEVIIDTIAYDTAKTIQQLDNVLYLGNTTGSQDVGYQKYANNIKLRARVDIIRDFDEFYASVDNFESGWGHFPVNDYGGVVQTVDPTKSYRYVPNIFKWKGYMRDEVYAFYIAFILNDGSMSYAYHIPGREALWNEKESVSGLNGTTYGGLWNDIHDVSPQYGKRFHWIDSTVDSIHGGSYSASTARNMNYWENATEFYPNTENYQVWDAHAEGSSGQVGSLIEDGIYNTSDVNVRHHHFPSNRNSEMKSILDDTNCRTSNTSSGSSSNQIVYDGLTITLFDEHATGNVGNSIPNPGSWAKVSYPRTDGGSFITNSADMQDAIDDLWNAGAREFTANSSMDVRVKWVIWYEQNGGWTTKPFTTRLRTNAGGSPITVNSDNNCACPYSSYGCGGGQTDANRQPYVWGNFALTGVSSGGGVLISNMQPGDKIWLESAQDTSGGVNYWQADVHEIDCHCNGGGNGQPCVCDTAGISGTPCISAIEFEITSTFLNVEPTDYADAKISHNVQRLGFDLEDIKIPQSIADKVQGFRIYYANRTHSDRTVLGQSSIIPAQKKRSLLGVCEEAIAGGQTTQALQAMQTLGIQPEDFYNLVPFSLNPPSYPILPFYNDLSDSGAGIVIGEDHAYDVFTFHDFYLQRTKNSLSPATHIDIQYRTRNLVWNGPGVDQDKRMNTLLVDDPTTTSDVIKVKEVWGWDEEQNCYPQLIGGAIIIGAMYDEVAERTMPRLLGQKAKTYMLGDTIFKGESLGFGAKLFNEFGESAIVFKLMNDHAISARRVQSHPRNRSWGYFADTYGANAPETVYGMYGEPLESYAILVNRLDSSGDWVQDVHGKRSQSAIVNLKAFKTDVYKSIDSQELVWTGFEVLGEELNNYIFDVDGNMRSGGTGNTIDTHPDGIYGGDTFLCRHGITPALKPSNEEESSTPKKAIHYHIVESTDNINFRHQDSDKSMYFPQTPAKSILKESGVIDFHHFDNIAYNENYSEANTIRPAIPLPLRDVVQDQFPTRTHRSAKHDTTSIIDNYRIFLANQFKDLPKNRGELWKLSSFNNLLYFHMEESLFAAQGKQTMSMGDGSEAFVGSGDIFAQEPNEVVQTEGGFGGTQSQWAALTTRHGYFFVDGESKKIFIMKERLEEISKLGMKNWFKDNLGFVLEEYGLTSGCMVDNPIAGTGFHAIWDPKFRRIILTKREFEPTQAFIDGTEATTIQNPCNAHPWGHVRFFKDACMFKYWGVDKDGNCAWLEIPWRCYGNKYFNCGGWTISYYPELGVWGSFHDYIPYIYFNTSLDFYSLTDQYPRPVWILGQAPNIWRGTTFGNAGIWQHNSPTNYGILYQENNAGQYGAQQFLDAINHHNFEFEFIHNEYKAEDTLLSSFNYTLETFNQAGITVLEHGFTSFFVYNTFQISGIGPDWLDLNGTAQRDINNTAFTAANVNALEYLVNIRRVGNNWKVNNFRDMAATATDTNAYYMSANPNVIGATNTGTITTSSTNTMFSVVSMNKIVNGAYIDLAKTWNLQKKFIDKWIGIRLIYNNVSNNLLNLYSTDVAVRKMHR